MKHVIRFLCGVLAALTVLAAVSCKQEPPEPEEPTPVSVSLDGYTVIRSQNAGSEAIAAAKQLRLGLKAAGATVQVMDDWLESGSPDPEAKEILLGDTNRPESAALKSILKKEGWAITLSGGKLVIAATRERFLADAVAHLTDTLLKGSATLSVVPDHPILGAPYEMIRLATDKTSAYRIVRSEDSFVKSDKTLDLTSTLCSELRELFRTKTGARIGIVMDTVADPDAGTPEILVGATNRPESTRALEGIPADGYVVRLLGDTLVLNAWSLKGVEQAVLAFERLIEAESTDGSLSIPAGYSQTGVIGDTVDGVPEPAGVTLRSSYRGLDKTFESVWVGATSGTLDAYGETLIGAGYSLYQAHTIGKNRFTVWTKGNVAVYASYFPWDGTLRVISETFTDLPEKESGTMTKVTPSSLTQLSLDDAGGNFGMAYVFTLEDGSYFLIDGGGRAGNDETVLYSFLRDHNKRPDGKIVIAAWLFTHEHWDHVTNFLDFTEKYAGQVTLERVYWNFAQSYEHGEAGAYHDAMEKAFGRYPGVRVMKIHAGQSIWVRNANLEILYTHETLTPYTLPDMNDTSTVFRVNIAGKRVLFLADISTLARADSAVKVVYGLYGGELKSDILQVGHHGWNGGSDDIYHAVLPETALWPVEASRWNTVSRYQTSKTLLELQKQGVIKHLYVAKDGEVTLTFD